MNASEYHLPVLREEVVRLLLATPARGEVLDGTVGGGGHARALLEADDQIRILAVDRDPEALEETRRVLAPWKERVRFVESRFDEAARGAGLLGPSLRGALLDLGVSSRQLDADRRGFSYRTGEAPLDMRMGGANETAETAADLLNTLDEGALARIFRRYGEEPRARRLAGEIVKRRATEPFETAKQLLDAITVVHRRAPTAKEKARVFQALRIQVNQEMEALEEALPLLRDALHPEGVLCVIAYHSLEDRIVKDVLRSWSRSCICPPGLPICACRGEVLGELLTRKIVRPSEAEVEANPRARSARLRAWRKAA